MWTHFLLSHCGYPVCTGYEDFVLASVHWLRGFMITQCKLGKLPIAQWVGPFCISQCALAIRDSNGTSRPALMRTAGILIYVALYTGSVHPVCADW